MSDTTANNSYSKEFQGSTEAEIISQRLTAEQFWEWYQERQYRLNIQNGQSYFNGSGSVPNPERHSPSQLLQCHRKLVYRQENAPAEEPDPDGIFWFGTKFEEELLFPFLERWVTGSETYVQNSIWIDFTVDTAAGELQIKGSTDPVIVDPDAVPILPTEIKTKSSVSNVTKPNRHHRAQIHAYLAGLSEKFDKDLSDAIIVYGSRESLNVKTFQIEFDELFWEDIVLEWATEHTQYRINDELPPGDPEYDWECQFCSYQNRCGKGDAPQSDIGPTGLLPSFGDYPKEKVTEYLEGHPDETLTPTLACQYPDLVDVYGVSDFYCRQCGFEVNWQAVDDAGEPLCPPCADRGEISILTVPLSENRPTNHEPLQEQKS